MNLNKYFIPNSDITELQTNENLIWLHDENLRNHLDDSGFDNIGILELSTSQLNFIPIIADDKNFVYEQKSKTFISIDSIKFFPLNDCDDKEIIFQSEAKKIGNLFWIAVVYKDKNFSLHREKKLSKLYGTSVGNGIYNTFYFYNEGNGFRSHWTNMKNHPNYNMNDGTYSGLPKGLVKLYEEYESQIKCALKGIEPAPCSLFEI